MDSFEIIKIKNSIKNDLVPTPKKISIKDPTGQVKLFYNCCAIGKKNSGKTNSTLRFAEHCIKNKLVNNSYLITTTFDNNNYDFLQLKEENIFKNITNDDELEEAMQIIDEEIKEKNKKWRELRDSLTSSQYNKFYKEAIKKYLYYEQIKDIAEQEELAEFELNDFEKEHLELNDFQIKPTYYNKIPSHLIYIDDMQSIISEKKRSRLNNMIIRNRHNMTNFILNFQNMKNGPSRRIRANLNYWLIFKYEDKDIIKEIYDELAGVFKNYEQFLKIYEYCTSEPFNFMLVEMDNNKQVRHNFDEIIKLK